MAKSAKLAWFTNNKKTPPNPSPLYILIGLVATGLGGESKVLTSSSRRMVPEWSQGPLVRDAEGTAWSRLGDERPDDGNWGDTATGAMTPPSGMSSKGSSKGVRRGLSRARNEAVGGMKDGWGREGSLCPCLGCPRAGSGAVAGTSSKEVGGERRGIVICV
jgi:hypothetical protein